MGKVNVGNDLYLKGRIFAIPSLLKSITGFINSPLISRIFAQISNQFRLAVQYA